MSVLSVGFVFRTTTPKINPTAAPTKVKRTNKFAFKISKHFSFPTAMLQYNDTQRPGQSVCVSSNTMYTVTMNFRNIGQK